MFNFLFYIHNQGYYGHSGASSTYDPYSDELDRPFYRYSAPTADIPDVIKQFIQYFHTSIKEGRVYEIQDLYENTSVNLISLFKFNSLFL